MSDPSDDDGTDRDATQAAPKIGYGRPPEHSRFAPGRSGNPKGRAKGASGFKTDLMDTLKMPVIVNDGGRKRKISSQQAALLRLRERALKGEPRAVEKYLQLAAQYNLGELDPIGTALLLEEDQAILVAYWQTYPRSSGND